MHTEIQRVFQDCSANLYDYRIISTGLTMSCKCEVVVDKLTSRELVNNG